jgi:hypothetical protein
MQCQGEPKDKTPLKTRRGVHVPQVQPPNNRTQPKNKLTVYLVDVASADHGDKALRPGSKKI